VHSELESEREEVARLTHYVNTRCNPAADNEMNEMLAQHERWMQLDQISELQDALQVSEQELMEVRAHGQELWEENSILKFENQSQRDELERLRSSDRAATL